MRDTESKRVNGEHRPSLMATIDQEAAEKNKEVRLIRDERVMREHMKLGKGYNMPKKRKHRPQNFEIPAQNHKRNPTISLSDLNSNIFAQKFQK